MEGGGSGLLDGETHSLPTVFVLVAQTISSSHESQKKRALVELAFAMANMICAAIFRPVSSEDQTETISDLQRF